MKCSAIFFQIFIIVMFTLSSAANADLEPIEISDCIQKILDPDLIAYGDCTDAEGGSTGPTRPPSTPPSISYVPYSNEESITISWAASNGYNGRVTYKLYESKNNEAWREIYSGPMRNYSIPPSFKARSQTQSKKGVYRFRVQAENTKGSSGYRVGSKMIINPLHVHNLYSKYGDILRYMDEKNSHYQSTSGNGIKIALDSNQTSPFERFFLGDGYDLIRGALKETCLNVEDEDFKVEKRPLTLGNVFEISYVNDNRHLAELLDISSSARIGFDLDETTVGLSGESGRYVRSVTDESYIRFVVKVKIRKEFWTLRTPVDAIDPVLVDEIDGILRPNDNNAKISFRERCGDNFINSANLGSALYLVFEVNAKSYSREERNQVRAMLGVSLGDVFNANGASSSSETLEERISSLNVTIRADQVGGPPGLASFITLENIEEKYNEFISHFSENTNKDNWAAVDFTTSEYLVPRAYQGYSHEEIFANYKGNQGPLAQMQRWLDITVQHKERCDPWAEYNQPVPSSCETSAREINIAMDLCRQTSEWESCIHPHAYNTGSLTAINEGTALLGWLSENVKKLHTESQFQSYNHYVHKGSLQVNDQTCLSSSDCFVNTFYGARMGLGKGFVITDHEYDNPRGGNESYTISPDHCLTSSLLLKTTPPRAGIYWGDTTAIWNYTIHLKGLCPKVEDFVVIP